MTYSSCCRSSLGEIHAFTRHIGFNHYTVGFHGLKCELRHAGDKTDHHQYKEIGHGIEHQMSFAANL